MIIDVSPVHIFVETFWGRESLQEAGAPDFD